VNHNSIKPSPFLSRNDEGSLRDKVGVIGATGLVGSCLLSLLTQTGWRVTAYYRRQPGPLTDGVEWLSSPQHPFSSQTSLSSEKKKIQSWICTAPVWVLPEYFALLETYGARRVIALSSTSRFTKQDSSDLEEQAVSRRLDEAESSVREWAESRGVEWVILRPTLIYGFRRDKNIAEIARFIRRFGFFPLFGKAHGLRQPIHVQDVAQACLTAVTTPIAANRAYNISGGETLSYREMVTRVFTAMDRPSRLLPVPLLAFRIACALLRILPRYRHWSVAMAERMNRDMAFDHSEAARDLAFKPRAFELFPEDI
jgi:nucleoside-diphosphate-sugar epimerase